MCPWVAESSFPLNLCRQTQARTWQRCYRTLFCVQRKCVHKRLVGHLWALVWLLHSFTTNNVGVERWGWNVWISYLLGYIFTDNVVIQFQTVLPDLEKAPRSRGCTGCPPGSRGCMDALQSSAPLSNFSCFFFIPPPCALATQKS